nr:MAG TPA: hypothetical protein [Caudoviricetes sp.]
MTSAVRLKKTLTILIVRTSLMTWRKPKMLK